MKTFSWLEKKFYKSFDLRVEINFKESFGFKFPEIKRSRKHFERQNFTPTAFIKNTLKPISNNSQ